MSLLRESRVVALWVDDGVPARLVWRGERYVVSDRPTPLEDCLFGITHPPSIRGWRFQGTRLDGVSLVFDVIEGESAQEWLLVAVHE